MCIVIFSGHLYKNGTDVGGWINTEGGVYRFTSIMGEVPKLVFGMDQVILVL